MNTPTISGTLIDAAGLPCSGRVCSVAPDGTVLQAATADGAGRWQLAAPHATARVLGSASATGIAAGVAPAQTGAAIVLAPTETCDIELHGAGRDTQVWLDPLQLDGLPAELLAALRATPDGAVLLHIGTWDAAPGRLSLALQRGTYRVSGGRLAIGDSDAAAALGIGSVVDAASGTSLRRRGGDWLLDVRGPVRCVVRYEVTP